MVPLELVANLTTRQNQGGGLISDSKNVVVVFAVILRGKSYFVVKNLKDFTNKTRGGPLGH